MNITLTMTILQQIENYFDDLFSFIDFRNGIITYDELYASLLGLKMLFVQLKCAFPESVNVDELNMMSKQAVECSKYANGFIAWLKELDYQ